MAQLTNEIWSRRGREHLNGRDRDSDESQKSAVDIVESFVTTRFLIKAKLKPTPSVLSMVGGLFHHP